MLSSLTSSLRSKLLLSFVLIGLLPFIILLSYTLFLSETKIVNQIVQEQLSHSNNVAKLIQSKITLFKQEIEFLASLDIMDDILADDIDKRISILLSKKTTDFRVDLSLIVVDTKDNIIASSDNAMLLKKFSLYDSLNKKSFIDSGYLYISSKIYASFDSAKKIGYLVMKYNLQNFGIYLAHGVGMHSYMVSQDKSTYIGDSIRLKFNIQEGKNSAITDEHVIVYNKLQDILSSYYLVYAEDKSIALKFLYDFMKFMIYVALLILLFIIVIAVKYSKGIVKPIEELTSATRKIITNQDYSSEIQLTTKDEIATLTFAFNEMLLITKKALENLEQENKLRLQRFTQLIEVFNKIIQTDDEQKCIEVSIAEIKEITTREDLYFSREKSLDGISIYVSDFSKGKKVYFGTISLRYEEFEDANEKHFYKSIASMISLQLDHIRLINTTTSASNAKSAFISTMSHELRTPLNSIIGSTQFLLSYEQMSDTQQDSIATIESSAHYLLGMINEILDIAKIEAGVMKVKNELVNVEELVSECYVMLQPLADDKELDFKLEVQTLTHNLIHTDRALFQQIIINLLSNAIKFTEKGYVKLLVHPHNKELIIEVADSGIGIEKKNLDILFDEFTQVENMMQKKHKGTGLGLALCKKMAQLLDGDVLLESEGLGRGAKAIFAIKSLDL